MSVTAPPLPRRALLLIDVQNEYITGTLPIEYPDVRVSLANIARAAQGALAAGIPIVVVQQSAPVGSPIFAKGSEGWKLHDTVASLRRAHHIEKSLPSAFAGTDLAEWLHRTGIDTIVIAGYMTQNCNDATARQAVHEGWAVEYLEDATGALAYANRAGQVSAEQIHKVYCVVLQSRFAAVMSTDEWLQTIQRGALPERDGVYSSSQKARSVKKAAP
jgi:nicotinamidase-related amidase